MANIQYYGTGRRKSSVARVRLIPGTGNITINKKSLDEYIPLEIVKREVKRPFEIAGCEGKFDVIATVKFLTRDSRMKERKKYGLKKARKASQFSKR